jgi:hypothetical protein
MLGNSDYARLDLGMIYKLGKVSRLGMLQG